MVHLGAVQGIPCFCSSLHRGNISNKPLWLYGFHSNVAFQGFEKTFHHKSFDDIRVGDEVSYDNEYGGHTVIVLEKREKLIRKFLKANHFCVYFRYPS